MPKIDLREYKKEIRSQMRRIRREMSPQTVQEKNDRIYKRLIATQQYRRAKTVVVYVSKELEVDTRRLMEHAWADGKQVAAPRCVENTRLMKMHLIGSMEDLEEGAYGILEPYSNLPVLEDTTNAICIGTRLLQRLPRLSGGLRRRLLRPLSFHLSGSEDRS